MVIASSVFFYLFFLILNLYVGIGVVGVSFWSMYNDKYK